MDCSVVLAEMGIIAVVRGYRGAVMAYAMIMIHRAAAAGRSIT
jgi:hypothetical protein